VAVILALVSAAAWGVSDFLGGIFAKRSTAWQVATVGQASSAVCALVLALLVGGSPTGGDLLAGLLGGIGGGIGAAFLYRGLAGGRMAVAAPVSAVGTALVPVVAGLALGERPSAYAWIGIVLALPAIVAISYVPPSRDGAARESPRAAVLDGLVAGAGFGILFTMLDRVGDDAGFLPVALAQVGSVAAVVVLALALRAPFLPRAAHDWRAALMGPLGATATAVFLLATQVGLLTIVSVIASLYPALTVLLAAVVLRERVLRVQGLGLLLAAVAVAFVATGH